jgi:filamentous hemagglutinin
MYKKLITYLLIITFYVGLLPSPAVAFYSFGGTLNIGYGQSSSKSNSLDIWYTNSQTTTGDGTINIQSGKDTTVRGANIEGADVALDVGGNLTVESLQDEHHASNSSKGFSRRKLYRRTN